LVLIEKLKLIVSFINIIIYILSILEKAAATAAAA
jgi:hypothetical protein